jgi:patatin-like phospholipase/acyl hydrolase
MRDIMKKILCLSGGGVRGISQLMVLKNLEKVCGRPLHEEYDLILGSSVGAINAAIIASGKISMDDLSTIYPSLIKSVFKRRGIFKTPKLTGHWHDVGVNVQDSAPSHGLPQTVAFLPSTITA